MQHKHQKLDHYIDFSDKNSPLIESSSNRVKEAIYNHHHNHFSKTTPIKQMSSFLKHVPQQKNPLCPHLLNSKTLHLILLF
jgi:hypothetical protein